MDSQLTPVYNHLCNREFLLLQGANLLLSFVFYALVGLLPKLALFYHCDQLVLGTLPVGLTAVLCLVVGMCLSGPSVGWLVEHYRRNRMFVYAAALFGISIVLLPLMVSRCLPPALWLLLCLVAGMCYGVAGRVLTCILIIDKTESFNRNRAGLVSAVVSLFGVLLGVVAVFALSQLSMLYVEIALAACLLVAIVCVRVLNFPFRTPIEDVQPMSFDRFFLPGAWPWFCFIVLAAIVVGMIMGRYHALVPDTSFLSQVLLPMVGYGVLAVEMLKNMTERGLHCQRSTLLSTFFMAQNAGLPIGLVLSQLPL